MSVRDLDEKAKAALARGDVDEAVALHVAAVMRRSADNVPDWDPTVRAKNGVALGPGDRVKVLIRKTGTSTSRTRRPSVYVEGVVVPSPRVLTPWTDGARSVNVPVLCVLDLQSGERWSLVERDTTLVRSAGAPAPPKLADLVAGARKGSPAIGAFRDAAVAGWLIGWRVAGYDPVHQEAISGADSRQRVPLVRGTVHRLRGKGMFLAADADYVRDYYAVHEHNVLCQYRFHPSDVTFGELTDRQPEIAVRAAELVDFEVLD